MSNENDRPNNTWGDEDEVGPPNTFRDAYLDAANQNRARPRSGGPPQNDLPEPPETRARPRNASGGGRIYEESVEQPSRPRPTRQSRKEVEGRLRQRPRQTSSPREQEEERPRPTTRSQSRSVPRDEQDEVYPYHQAAPSRTPRASRGAAPIDPNRGGRRPARQHEEYDEYDEYEVIQERGGQPVRRRQGKHSRERSAFRTILVGCVSSLLTLALIAAIIAFFALRNTPLGQNLGLGKSTYTQSGNQALTLGSATQLIVKNQVGSISVNVEQSATSATLASVKKVQSSSSDDANSQFSQIKLSIKPISQGADPACTASSCLLVTTSIPVANGGGILGGSNGASIDLNIILPTSFSSPDPLAPYTISVSTATGNIAVNGFNGILNLTGNVGNVDINVTHALIYAGTCIQTTHGSVTIGQGSFFDLNHVSSLVPCNGTTSTQTHPWFNISSGVGNVAIALAANSTDLLLDANTNNGAITDEFGLNIPTGSDGSASYHGPLLPDTNPTASLYVAASTGNIAINKQ